MRTNKENAVLAFAVRLVFHYDTNVGDFIFKEDDLRVTFKNVKEGKPDFLLSRAGKEILSFPMDMDNPAYGATRDLLALEDVDGVNQAMIRAKRSAIAMVMGGNF